MENPQVMSDQLPCQTKDADDHLTNSPIGVPLKSNCGRSKLDGGSHAYFHGCTDSFTYFKHIAVLYGLALGRPRLPGTIKKVFVFFNNFFRLFKTDFSRVRATAIFENESATTIFESNSSCSVIFLSLRVRVVFG